MSALVQIFICTHDGVNGLLFKTFDSNDLTDKLVQLHEDSMLREKYAMNGKKKAMDVFEDQKQFEKLRIILEQL